MTYSRYAPYGRVYRPANQWPEGSLEKRLATQMATQLNNGAACLLMYKYPGTTYFDDIRDWDGDASYRIVTPSRSNPGSDTEFSVTGQAKPSPESSAVLKPTQEEIEGIYDKKLVGRFADGELFTIPEAEETGAIPVIDIQDPNHYFYYVPAFFERLTRNERFFQRTPTFIAMNKGEMPSFVFWQRSDKWQRYQHKSTDPVVDAELPDLNPATPRSASKSPGKQAATPRKDSMSPEAKANTQDDRAVRSRAPSPQERSSALAVNIEAAAQVSKKPEAEAELQWEIFDPRLEEDPIEFLDFYNTRLNGWHANRSRMMLREADIERVNYISPCLAHNHKEVVKNTTAETATASAPAIAPSPTAMDIDSTTGTVPKPPSKPWSQPAPIAHDDPHWLGFLRKQKQRRDVRKSRLRPKSIFTSEHCNTPGVTKGDGKKAFLSREMYNNYYRRACKAQRLNEGLSKCCVACGLKWTSCTESRQEHYNRHRHERLLYYKNIRNVPIHIEPVIRAESLDPSKVTFVRHVPDLNWFRELEKITLDNENELLQREHICRVCDKVIDLTDEDPAVHYYGHQCERDGLRKWQENEVQNPLSPVIVTTIEGSFQVPTQSPPARSHKGFSPNADFMRRHDEITKAQAAALSGNLSAAAKAIQRTGTVTSSVKPVGSLATVQSKRVENKTQQGETEPLQANTHAQKVTDYPNERSVHAKKADIPLLPQPPAKSPAKDSMEIDFIYEDSEVAQSPQEEVDGNVDDMVVASIEAVEEQVNLDAQDIIKEILREAPMMPAVLISDVIELVSAMVEACLEATDELDIGGLSHKDYIKQSIFEHIEEQLAKKSSSTTSTSFKSALSQQADSTPAYVPKTPAPTPASVPKASPLTKVPEIATEDTDAVEDEDSMSDSWSWDKSLVPVKNDGLDITPNEIDMQEILDNALNFGCSEKSVILVNADSEDVCRDLVDEYRASGKKPTPSVKRSIIAKVQTHLKEAIAHELIHQCAKNETETEAEAEAEAEAEVEAEAAVEAEAEPSSDPDDIDSKPISQTRGDCLDFLFGDLGVSEALEQAAFEEGAGLAFFQATAHRASELCYDMVEEARGSISKDKPAVVRRRIIKEIQNFVKAEIEKVLSSSSELGSKWSTEAVASSTPVVSPQSASAPASENYGRILRVSDPAISSLWIEAYEWGCGPNNLAVYRAEALDVVKDLITASRKSGKPLSLEAKESARQKALALLELRISTEKDWRLASGQRLDGSHEDSLQPTSAPAPDGLDMSYGDPDIESLFDEATEWGCEMTTLAELAQEALDTGHEMIEAIRSSGGTLTPKLKEAIQDEVVQHLESAIEKEKRLRLTGESDAASAKTLKRKRATTLPVTPVSNRKSKSTRDVDATFHPDTPAPFVTDEVSPRLRKVSRKSTDPLAKKSEVKKSKTVRYEPQVVISKKTTPKSIVSKKASTKTVPKSVSKKASAAAASSSEPRPKRKAAVEAEKSFGKTKIVD